MGIKFVPRKLNPEQSKVKTQRHTLGNNEELQRDIRQYKRNRRGGGWWVSMQWGGRQQRNPVDEVTYMPGVIRRLWLLCLCELWLWPPAPPATSSLLFILLRATIIGVWAQPAVEAARCEKTRNPPPHSSPSSHFLLSCRLGEKNVWNWSSGKSEALKWTVGEQIMFNSFSKRPDVPILITEAGEEEDAELVES